MRTIKIFSHMESVKITLENKQQYDELFLVKHLSKLMKKHFDAQLKEYGLTGHQGRILFFIAKNNQLNHPVNQLTIQNEFHLSKSTVSGLISRMLKAELIKKTPSKPSSNLIPMPKGQLIVNRISDSKKEVLNKLLKGLSNKEKEFFKSILLKLINNLEEEK